MYEQTDVIGMFHEGGWTMWVILLLTLLALPTASLALMTGNRMLAFVGIGFAAAIALTGVGGTMLGRHQVDSALAYVNDAHDRELIHEGGYREASRNLYFAGIVGVPLMLLSVAAFARAMQKQELR